MKKILLLTLFLFIAYQQSFSQTWRRVGHWGNQFTDIKWVNEETGYIAGENIILKTTDGGLSWIEQEAPTDHLMRALDFYDEENGLVVGEDGTVYRTTDGGQNWEIIPLGTTADLADITFSSSTTVFITGSSGTLYESTDGGLNWAPRDLGHNADFNSVFFINADSGYIATSSSRIIKTTNGGTDWLIADSGFESSLNDIHFLNDTVGYAVGDMGTIIKTEDAGETWTYINSGMDTDFNKVVFNPDNPLLGVVTGKSGTILRTSNGGLTFATTNSRTTQSIRGIGFRPASNMVYAVAAGGVVISSTNSGGSWTLRFSGRANNFTGVQFLTDLRGYIIGEEGLILLTGNGGSTFTVRSRPLSLPFNALHFVSNTAGFIAGNNGNIISTTNSGGAWTALNPGTNRHVYGMYFFSINIGYVVGSRGYIAKTDNRGVNWQTIDPGNRSIDFKDIGFFDNISGIIVGNAGWISRSDGGQEWSVIATNTTENLNALEIIDGETALAVGNNGIILKTTDQGRTWQKIIVPFTRNFNDIAFLDESVGFVVGDKGLILKTHDAGETWERMVTGTFQNLTGVSFGDPSTGYAVGENGAFFNYSCMVPEDLTVIHGEEALCLSEQVYSVQESTEPGISYEWRVDGGTILDGQGTSRMVVRWDSPGRNAVMVRGTNNCGNGRYSALEVVVTTEPDQVQPIVGSGTACLNALEDYQVEAVPGTEYVWETRGGIVRAGQGTANVTIEWTHLGQQSLQVTPTNACGAGNTLQKTIQINTFPVRPSEIDGPSLVGLEEVIYQIDAVPGINYQWSAGEGGRIVDGQGSGSVKVLWEKEGDHTLTVTPMNACNEGESRTLAVNVNYITAIEDEYAPGFSVYPNPSSGDIIVFTRGIPDVRDIRVYNSLGQEVFQGEGRPAMSEFKIHNLPTGVHTVFVRSRTKNYIKMIVVQ